MSSTEAVFPAGVGVSVSLFTFKNPFLKADFRESLGIIFTIDNADSYTAASGAHGRHMEPLVCLSVIRLDRRQTCKHAERQSKVQQSNILKILCCHIFKGHLVSHAEVTTTRIKNRSNRPVLPSKPPTAYRSPLSTEAPSVDRRSCMLLTLVQRSIIGS